MRAQPGTIMKIVPANKMDSTDLYMNTPMPSQGLIYTGRRADRSGSVSAHLRKIGHADLFELAAAEE